jgi:hypothetical protein
VNWPDKLSLFWFVCSLAPGRPVFAGTFFRTVHALTVKLFAKDLRMPIDGKHENLINVMFPNIRMAVTRERQLLQNFRIA